MWFHLAQTQKRILIATATQRAMVTSIYLLPASDICSSNCIAAASTRAVGVGVAAEAAAII